MRVDSQILVEVKFAEIQHNRIQQLLCHCQWLINDWCIVGEPFDIHLSLSPAF